MAKVLAVSHSIGDSQVIFESAKELAKDGTETTILVVGQAARGKIDALLKASQSDFITMIDLDETLPESQPIKNNQLTLSLSDIAQLTEAIDVQSYSALLMGTPSYVKVEEQSEIQQQLLNAWSCIIHSTVVSDYAFYDPNHHLASRRWFEKASKFLLPFSKAKDSYGVSEEQAVIVGHTSVDATKSLYAAWINERINDLDPKIRSVRDRLGIQEHEKFIFVAAGKAGDEDMVKALANTCKEYPAIKIYLGMHPAADASYLETIQQIIIQNNLQNQMLFVPKGLVTTDEAVYAADGVMTVSSTVGTTAGACGKPVAFYQEGKSQFDSSVPYIVADCDSVTFCTSSEQLLPFYTQIMSRSNKIAAENVALGTTAAEKIATEIKKFTVSG